MCEKEYYFFLSLAHLKKSHLACASSLLPPGRAHTQNCLSLLGPCFFTFLSTHASLWPLQRGVLGPPLNTSFQAPLSLPPLFPGRSRWEEGEADSVGVALEEGALEAEVEKEKRDF